MLRQVKPLLVILLIILPVITKAASGCLDVFASQWQTLAQNEALAYQRTMLLLSAADFSAPNDDVLRSLVLSPEERGIVAEVAGQLAAGRTWQEVMPFDSHLAGKSSDGKAAVFANPLYKTRWILNEGQGWVGDLATKSRHVRLFPAEFRSFPIDFFERGSSRLGIPDEAHIFALIPKPAVRREIESALGSDLSFPHLQSAFAYIRYYVRGSDVIVSEIQSDVYRNLKNNLARAKFEHWSRVLLLAFQLHIERTFCTQGHPQCRVIVTGPEYQLRRWENIENPLSTDLVRILYRDLPTRLGFKLEPHISYAFEWPEHQGPEFTQPLVIGQGWSLTSIADDKNPFISEFRKHMQAIDENMFEAAFASIQGLRETLHLPVKTETPLISLQIPELIRVSQKPLPIASMAGINASLLKTYKKMLLNIPSEILAQVSPFETFLRLPPKEGISSSVQNGSMTIFSVHHEGMDRHPQAVFQLAHEFVWSLGIKGGGARTVRPDNPKYQGDLNARELALPFYKVHENNKPPRTRSHAIWGGLSLQEAEIEFLNTLAVHDLVRQAEPEEWASVSWPLDVGVLTEIPILEKGALRTIPFQEYRGRYLPDLQDQLATFRTLRRSNLRIATTINEVFNPKDPIRHGQFVLGRLKEVYRSWGEPFQAPVDVPFCGVHGSCDARDILIFLNQVYLENREAADRIVSRMLKETLRTIALVHGAGGHLGGSAYHEIERGQDILFLDSPVGASRGGATAPRNMTVRGEMADLDGSVYLPWILRPDISGLNHFAQRQLMESLKHKDLQYWELAMYWFRHLIQGRILREGQTLLEYPYGDPEKSGLLIYPESFDRADEKKFQLVESRLAERPLLSKELEEWYELYRNKGASLMK